MPLHHLTLQGDHELNWGQSKLTSAQPRVGGAGFLSPANARGRLCASYLAAVGGEGSPSVTVHTLGPLLLSPPSALQCGWDMEVSEPLELGLQAVAGELPDVGAGD